MKRVLRTLLNAATVLSVLLGLITLVIWMRSHYHPDELEYENVMIGSAHDDRVIAETNWQLTSVDGGVWLYMHWVPARVVWDGPQRSAMKFTITHDGDCTGAAAFETFGIGLSGVSNSFGFAHEILPSFGSIQFRAYRVPHYALAGAAWMLPVLRLAWKMAPRFRRRKIGHCPICGYDLRATPDRCPECGTARELSKS